ncbi:hypothetical protein B0H11DRAFT_2406625 [Mycena galericulata]|nr:hypothetical protein B0H11DRAFT_2406625 [Mycena galericulata]
MKQEVRKAASKVGSGDDCGILKLEGLPCVLESRAELEYRGRQVADADLIAVREHRQSAFGIPETAVLSFVRVGWTGGKHESRPRVFQQINTISQETAHFANVGPINIAAQLNALTIAVNNLTNTVNNNHAAVMGRLNDIDSHMPMRLHNATASFDQPLRGPNMAAVAHPHPRTRDVLLDFTAAFNLPPARLPAIPNVTVNDRRRQIARFLGVGFD